MNIARFDFRHGIASLSGMMALLFLISLLAGCGNSGEEKSGDNAANPQPTGDENSNAKEEVTGESEEVTKLFNIVTDEMTDDVYVVDILCEPNIGIFSPGDIKSHAEHIVEDRQDNPKIKISYYNADETPGASEPTFIYEWTKDDGLVRLK